TAIRGSAPSARRVRLIIVGSSPGGRLSITNQSRSSSALAAVLRPAPDIPVMITMSVTGPGGGPRPIILWSLRAPPCVSRCCLAAGPGLADPGPVDLGPVAPRPQGGEDGVGQMRADAGYQRQLLRGGRGDPPDRAEVP